MIDSNISHEQLYRLTESIRAIDDQRYWTGWFNIAWWEDWLEWKAKSKTKDWYIKPKHKMQRIKTQKSKILKAEKSC